MKRLIGLALILLAFGASAFAEKQYVNVTVKKLAGNGRCDCIYLTGSVPETMCEAYYYYNSYVDAQYNPNVTEGNILNELSKNGFAVEQMSCSTYTASSGNSMIVEVIILSKESGSPSAGANEMDLNKDHDVDVGDVNVLLEYILNE